VSGIAIPSHNPTAVAFNGGTVAPFSFVAEGYDYPALGLELILGYGPYAAVWLRYIYITIGALTYKNMYILGLFRIL